MIPSDRTQRRLFQLGAILALAAAVVIAAVVASSGSDAGTKKRPGETVAGQTEVREMLSGIPQDGITLGDPKAKVTIVEFADLQCPFCKDFSQQTLPLVVRDYVRTGKAKIEFRNLAFIGEDSVRAADAAAAAATQDRLWNFVDLFYFNQGEENSGYVTDEFLGRVARAAGSAKRSGGGQAAIAAANTLAQRYGVDSTPTLVVDGKKVDGFDYETVKAAIDKALAA
ncbi:MAG TPA: thioredoxin domain-containing protein [Solirubrobacteraceae bacterium]